MKFIEYLQEKTNITLVKGEKYEVPSNRGGAFEVVYKGIVNGQHRFQSITKGWDKGVWKYHDYTEEQVNKLVKIPAKPKSILDYFSTCNS
jgi:hypothetical protein